MPASWPCIAFMYSLLGNIHTKYELDPTRHGRLGMFTSKKYRKYHFLTNKTQMIPCHYLGGGSWMGGGRIHLSHSEWNTEILSTCPEPPVLGIYKRCTYQFNLLNLNLNLYNCCTLWMIHLFLLLQFTHWDPHPKFHPPPSKPLIMHPYVRGWHKGNKYNFNWEDIIYHCVNMLLTKCR